MSPSSAFERLDNSPDERFYGVPRFVEHLDDAALAAVTQLYRERFPPGAHIVDLMSSWVSHLPPEVAYASVTGLGMNERELAENPRLDAYLVHDLNVVPALPFATACFDAAAICVSVQYLTQPVAVLREAARVLRPGGPIAITYSNRCFPTKAVAVWHALDERGHAVLVEGYLREAGWTEIETLDRSPGASDPLFAVMARRRST